MAHTDWKAEPATFNFYVDDNDRKVAVGRGGLFDNHVFYAEDFRELAAQLVKAAELLEYEAPGYRTTER